MLNKYMVKLIKIKNENKQKSTIITLRLSIKHIKGLVHPKNVFIP